METALRGLSLSELGGCSPFGGIPRNWKLVVKPYKGQWVIAEVPPSGGSLEIGNEYRYHNERDLRLKRSPFGGIPRNWKHLDSTYFED